MTDLLKQGSDWLESMRNSHCTSQVVYRRGVFSETINATFGQTSYEIEDAYGIRTGAFVVDFLILADALSFDEPEMGDHIIVDSVVYEVMELPGQGHWRWSDPYRTTMRIHTKEIGTE